MSVDSAEYVSASLSGSLKWDDTTTAFDPPVSTACGGIALSIRGARFVGGAAETVTLNFCETIALLGSRAVTVTSAVPFDTPRTRTVSRLTDTVATFVSVDSAEYVSASLSGSLKCGDNRTATDAPASTSRAAIALLIRGAWFVGGAASTVTWNRCDTSAECGSRAVTVTSAFPFDTPRTHTVSRLTDTVATLRSDDVAEYVSASLSGSLKCGDTTTASDVPATTV